MTPASVSPRPNWRDILLLASAYFLAAILSRLLAIPPGYATIVWPAAGLALGALWIWGKDLWPGVLLGSFAANLWSLPGTTVPMPVVLAAWISIGAAAQAYFATSLARRVLGERDPLIEEGDLFWFLIITGPFSCLIASSWAVAGMRLLGAIDARGTAFAWTTWWIGDAIGVAATTPMLLLWWGRDTVGPRRSRAIVCAVLAATMMAVAVVHLYALRNEEELQRVHASQMLTDASLTLNIGLAGHLDALQTTADIFANENELTRAEFHYFALSLLARLFVHAAGVDLHTQFVVCSGATDSWPPT